MHPGLSVDFALCIPHPNAIHAMRQGGYALYFYASVRQHLNLNLNFYLLAGGSMQL
jgi:hypothetical protein